MKSHVLLVVLSLSFASVSLAGPTLIYNGDFELGDIGFWSAYTDHTYDPSFGPLDGGGKYMVAHTPQEGHPNWPDYGDHTSGSGLTLLANGAPDQRVAWRQTVNVAPHRDYMFSYYLSSWGTASPSRIETRINGQVLGTDTQPTELPSWLPVSYVWNSGTNTTATIEWRDLETPEVGNDFMLDDIGISQNPISNIAQADLAGSRTSGVFGWDYRYHPSFDNEQVPISFDIQLIGDDPGQALRDQWLRGMEGIWSDHYEVVDGTLTYPILFDIDWVDSGADFVVTVHDENGRANMLNWYTQSDWGDDYQDEIAAHELGHMLGLYDEYDGGAVDPLTHFITSDALMADLGPVQERYYLGILAWLETASGLVDLSLALANAPAYPHDPVLADFSDLQATIPAPGAIVLGAIGAGLVGTLRRRRAL